MYKIIYLSVLLSLVENIISAPQKQEEKEHLELTDPITVSLDVHNKTTNNVTALVKMSDLEVTQKENDNPESTVSITIYKFVTEPIIKIVSAPKVNAVLRNIGTCIVNGAMEIFSHYLPPAFMPLVASAAGLVIPFEPVVMLKERMPVTSYRRAFSTAMKTFLRTFDQYKVEDEYDPYMTQRFNRRFMNDKSNKINSS